MVKVSVSNFSTMTWSAKGVPRSKLMIFICSSPLACLWRELGTRGTPWISTINVFIWESPASIVIHYSIIVNTSTISSSLPAIIIEVIAFYISLAVVIGAVVGVSAYFFVRWMVRRRMADALGTALFLIKIPHAAPAGASQGNSDS